MPTNGIEQSGGSVRPNPLNTPSSRDAQEPRAPGRADDNGAANTTPARDRIEISDAARSLSNQPVDGVAGSTPVEPTSRAEPGITADRVRAILARVSEGFYESPAVRGEIANKLLPELRSPDAR